MDLLGSTPEQLAVVESISDKFDIVMHHFRRRYINFNIAAIHKYGWVFRNFDYDYEREDFFRMTVKPASRV